ECRSAVRRTVRDGDELVRFVACCKEDLETLLGHVAADEQREEPLLRETERPARGRWIMESVRAAGDPDRQHSDVTDTPPLLDPGRDGWVQRRYDRRTASAPPEGCNGSALQHVEPACALRDESDVLSE